MPISLPSNFKAGRKVFQSDFEYVALQFPFLRLAWNSGDRNASRNEGAKYYGGFQRGEDEIQADLAAMNLPNLPSGFTQPVEWESSEGAKYLARSARHIYAAPIVAKVDWWVPRGETKKKHRLDFLVYLASLDDKKLVPWGVAVISSTNLRATSIEDVFKTFSQETREARRKFARYDNGQPIDAMFFYHCIGTFGQERVVERAGQSTYVPCQLNKPQEWTEEHMTKYFVGEEVAAIMISRQGEAAEWADDTNENRQKKGKPAPAATAAPDEISDAEGPENFDEVPF